MNGAVKPAGLALLAGGVVAVSAGAAFGAERIIASAPGADVLIANNSGTAEVTFSGVEGVGEATGFGATGLFRTLNFHPDGLGPWSTDVGLRVTAPGGEVLASPEPWFGDVTIADFPLRDGFAGGAWAGGVEAEGTFGLSYDLNGIGAPYTASLLDVTYYLLGPAPDVRVRWRGSTDGEELWNRPYFIAGVSGLGATTFDVAAFRVSVSGLYTLTSVLQDGRDHFTFLYEGSFDPQAPLEGLFDYGLGNGNSSFGEPRGTSRIRTLLFEGVDYYWVTSRWAPYVPVSVYENTVEGPGAIEVFGGTCLADRDLDGDQDVNDLLAYLGAFRNREASADVDADGVLSVDDLLTYLGLFRVGC